MQLRGMTETTVNRKGAKGAKMPCIQKINGECQVTNRLDCEFADWPMEGPRPHVKPPPGVGAVLASEPNPDRRERLAAAYEIVPFPECLRKPTFPPPEWMREVLADYEDRLQGIVGRGDAEDAAECTA